ncbi:hypothetical protein ON010_g11085 [Phytophthora cinnamomi]|nr:hypothetical protein ON010_g11085 [Phytophthora cinnamomi]
MSVPKIVDPFLVHQHAAAHAEHDGQRVAAAAAVTGRRRRHGADLHVRIAQGRRRVARAAVRDRHIRIEARQVLQQRQLRVRHVQVGQITAGHVQILERARLRHGVDVVRDGRVRVAAEVERLQLVQHDGEVRERVGGQVEVRDGAEARPDVARILGQSRDVVHGQVQLGDRCEVGKLVRDRVQIAVGHVQRLVVGGQRDGADGVPEVDADQEHARGRRGRVEEGLVQRDVLDDALVNGFTGRALQLTREFRYEVP